MCSQVSVNSPGNPWRNGKGIHEQEKRRRVGKVGWNREGMEDREWKMTIGND